MHCTNGKPIQFNSDSSWSTRRRAVWPTDPGPDRGCPARSRAWIAPTIKAPAMN